jgi:hypothetical protein
LLREWVSLTRGESIKSCSEPERRAENTEGRGEGIGEEAKELVPKDEAEDEDEDVDKDRDEDAELLFTAKKVLEVSVRLVTSLSFLIIPPSSPDFLLRKLLCVLFGDEVCK